MASPSSEDFLSNAERLLSDAEHLHAEGRCRSAATLVVVALEQMGAFVEALTLETYPGAKIHIGIFGNRANAHAKRQDALAGHVLNFADSQFMIKAMVEAYVAETGSFDVDKFLPWVFQVGPCELTDKQQQEQRECPDLVAANLLMRLTRTNVLKELREYGLYENASRTFSDVEIKKIIDLAAAVRDILARSRAHVVPEPMQIAGINMPDGLVFDPVTRAFVPSETS